MSPLPGYQVIPSTWEAHHRPVVKQTLTAMCTIKRPNPEPPPYPRPLDWVEETTVWVGMCRLQQRQQEGSPNPGEQPTQTRGYLLALPFENGQGVPLPELFTGERGDYAVVRDRVFSLMQPLAGSLLWERDYIAEENQTQQQPG